MKRIFLLIACLSALSVTACTSESALPTPSGKGSIRAFNAIPASPDIRFLIEERLVGTIGYNQSTSPNRFDDFEYNFNFELFLPGFLRPERVLTYPHKLEAGRSDIFVLTGDAENPTVNIWSTPDREWVEACLLYTSPSPRDKIHVNIITVLRDDHVSKPYFEHGVSFSPLTVRR